MSSLVRACVRASRQLPGFQQIRAASSATSAIQRDILAKNVRSATQSLGHRQPMFSGRQLRFYSATTPASTTSVTATASIQPTTTRNLATAAAVKFEYPHGEMLPPLNVGVHSTAGKKDRNDDRVVSIRLSEFAHLVAIFDGHGGASVAEYLSNNIGAALGDELVHEPNDHAGILKRAMGYLESSLAAKKEEYLRVGSTAVLALVTSEQITVAHVGDSRAYLVQGEVATQITQDHRPAREDELQRIRVCGGKVSYRKNLPRVNDVLALSRSIGYYDLRSAGVIADPEIVQYDLNPEVETQLVLACDGVGDNVTPDTIACILASAGNEQEAAESLVQHALDQHGRDNMSAIVLSMN